MKKCGILLILLMGCEKVPSEILEFQKEEQIKQAKVESTNVNSEKSDSFQKAQKANENLNEFDVFKVSDDAVLEQNKRDASCLKEFYKLDYPGPKELFAGTINGECFYTITLDNKPLNLEDLLDSLKRN